MLTTRERKQRKADRLREWAEKREKKAAAVFKQSEPFRGDIAFNTQPGSFPFRAKLIAREDRAYQSLKKADSMQARADGIEAQAAHTIYSDDEDATERLQEKIARLKTTQEHYKAINAAIRKHAKAGQVAQVTALVGLNIGLTTKTALELLHPDFAGRIGIASYVLTANNANIRRLEGRLAQIEREAVHGVPWRSLWTKYAGPCCVCGVEIPAQTTAHYRRDDGLRHPECAQTTESTAPRPESETP